MLSIICIQLWMGCIVGPSRISSPLEIYNEDDAEYSIEA